MRPSQRKNDEMRKVTVLQSFTKHAEGSVLISFGDTKVICNASVIRDVPKFLNSNKQGWITCEYSMLPRSTHSRTSREAITGKQLGRTQEIQRMIGRALRAKMNLSLFPGTTIKVDCDVLQADGSTRAAAVTGGALAIEEATQYMQDKGLLIDHGIGSIKSPHIAAVSVGIYKGEPILDLDYIEDSNADSDVNIIMTHDDHIIEVQASSERRLFSESDFLKMITLGKKGVRNVLHQIYQ